MRRVDLMRRSQTPPWWDAVGALKFQDIPFCRRNDSIWAWFISCRDSLSSFSAPTRLEPLSERIKFTCPRRARNRRNTLMKESLSNAAAISIWTARDTRQVKSATHRLTELRPRLTSMGPKKSTPVLKKGGWSGLIRSDGRSAIFWCKEPPKRRRQMTQDFKTCRVTLLPWMIQNFSRSRDRTCSLPPWPETSCTFRAMMLEIGDWDGRMMGIVIATYCEVLIALMVAGGAEGPTPPDELPEPERPPELALAWSEVSLDCLVGLLLFVCGSLWRGVGWDPLHMSQVAHWVHSDLMCPLPRHPKHNLCFISSETLSLWRIFRNFRQACKECWRAQCRHGGRKAPGNFTSCAGFRVVADIVVAFFFTKVELDLPLFSD